MSSRITNYLSARRTGDTGSTGGSCLFIVPRKKSQTLKGSSRSSLKFQELSTSQDRDRHRDRTVVKEHEPDRDRTVTKKEHSDGDESKTVIHHDRD